MDRIEIGDRFYPAYRPNPVYVADREYQWNGARHIVGYYRHGLSQLVGIDLPESELIKVTDK